MKVKIVAPTESWELAITSPVGEVKIYSLPENSGDIIMVCHEEKEVKILRLFEMRKWKKKYGIDRIYGFIAPANHSSVGVPFSWKETFPKQAINEFILLLWHKTYNNF